MTDIPLNTYIERTDADREFCECPVPAGSDVTLWFNNGDVKRDNTPEEWSWEDCPIHITAYLVHELPRETLVAWGIVGGANHGLIDGDKEYISHGVAEYGGRVVKLVEVKDD